MRSGCFLLFVHGDQETLFNHQTNEALAVGLAADIEKSPIHAILRRPHGQPVIKRPALPEGSWVAKDLVIGIVDGGGDLMRNRQ